MNYLDILHHLVALYPDRLFNYNYSIQELGIGNYDHLWNVREDCALHECTFIPDCSFLVLQIMETQAISSVPVIDTDRILEFSL